MGTSSTAHTASIGTRIGCKSSIQTLDAKESNLTRVLSPAELPQVTRYRWKLYRFNYSGLTGLKNFLL
jgi:hypothetical protein